MTHISISQGNSRKVGVVGLGYVGLPVAIAFGRAHILEIGFDIDHGRIDELQRNFDRTRETSEAELRAANIRVSADAADLREADFFIVTVPTPGRVARMKRSIFWPRSRSRRLTREAPKRESIETI